VGKPQCGSLTEFERVAPSAAGRSCGSRLAIDGATRRTGSANFSTSGENAQDNDLIVIRDGRASADQFEAHFERMWSAAQPMIEFGPAIDALEPR
jgi:hypothetical protein